MSNRAGAHTAIENIAASLSRAQMQYAKKTGMLRHIRRYSSNPTTAISVAIPASQNKLCRLTWALAFYK